MSFLGKIKSLLQGSEPEWDLVHPTFGNLTSDVIGEDSDLWQSDVDFEPLGNSIGLTIYAGIDGPCEKLVEFYEDFRSNYLKELEWVSGPIFKEFEGWFGKRPEGTIFEDFEFTALGIPRDGNRNNEWFIAFECPVDPNGHMYTAEIRNGKVSWVNVDG